MLDSKCHTVINRLLIAVIHLHCFREFVVFVTNYNWTCIIPAAELEGEEGAELQRKLEMLNSMLDQDQLRKQYQYYIQSECECILRHFVCLETIKNC